MSSISNLFNGIKSDLENLHSPYCNKTRGILFVTASSVSVLGGAIISAVGGLLAYFATVNTTVFLGMPLGWALGGMGASLIISGMPVGFLLGSFFAYKAFFDLTGYNIKPV